MHTTLATQKGPRGLWGDCHSRRGRDNRVGTRKAGLASLVVDYMWGCRVRMSQGDSMHRRPRDASQRKDREYI